VSVNKHRLRWNELPAKTRHEIEAALGAVVVEARSEPGGYSPSLASRCVLDDGRRVFVKSCSSAQNPDTPAMMRREALVTEALPDGFPAPLLLHRFDDGGWVSLVFEEIDGRPPREPWDNDELRVVVAAIEALAEMADPSPVDGLDAVQVGLARTFSGWRALASGQADTAGLDDWSRRHLARLAEIEATWDQHASGNALVHCDLRADNVLIGGDGRVCFVDWPWARVGAAWLDLAFMLPSVSVHGGPSPEAIWATTKFAQTVEHEALTAVAVAFAGFVTEHALRPPARGLPAVRAFQAAQGEVSREWLRDRLGLP
jgi:aminoglycoside phosphotransferase (APT) family kinase protein